MNKGFLRILAGLIPSTRTGRAVRAAVADEAEGRGGSVVEFPAVAPFPAPLVVSVCKRTTGGPSRDARRSRARRPRANRLVLSLAREFKG